MCLPSRSHRGIVIGMSEKINDGGPAFPSPRAHSMTTGTEAKGMSLRDYFAAQAMVGLASDQNYDSWASAARAAYVAADAMLAARSARNA